MPGRQRGAGGCGGQVQVQGGPVPHTAHAPLLPGGQNRTPTNNWFQLPLKKKKDSSHQLKITHETTTCPRCYASSPVSASSGSVKWVLRRSWAAGGLGPPAWRARPEPGWRRPCPEDTWALLGGGAAPLLLPSGRTGLARVCAFLRRGRPRRPVPLGTRPPADSQERHPISRPLFLVLY